MVLRRSAALATALLRLGGCLPAPGSSAGEDTSDVVQRACPGVATDLETGPRWVQISLDGRVLPPTRARPGNPGAENPPEVAHLSADSVFDLALITDSGRLAALGFCPGVIGGAITTVAEARRLGLRPPPPALCVWVERFPAEVAVGDTLRVRPGQLDLMHECDRPPPGEVRWRSSDEEVLGVDSTGLVTGRRPGVEEAIARFETVEARVGITVTPT